MNGAEREKYNYNVAASVVENSHYEPKHVDFEAFVRNLLWAAERDYMCDDSNSLFDRGVLNREVFAEWIAETDVRDYDRDMHIA